MTSSAELYATPLYFTPQELPNEVKVSIIFLQFKHTQRIMKYFLAGTAVLGLAGYCAAQQAMKNCQGRQRKTSPEEKIKPAPEILVISAPAMPYVEGEYKLSKVSKDGTGFNGMPVWISTFQDEGINYCIYSDGERWKVGEHSEKDMARSMGWFKSSEPHENALLPHELEGCGIGFLRPAIHDDERQDELVLDSSITCSIPGTLTAVGPYKLGTHVQVVSTALLSSIVDDMEVDISAPLQSVGGQKGLVTGYLRDQFAALVVVQIDNGKVAHLPSIALRLVD